MQFIKYLHSVVYTSPLSAKPSHLPKLKLYPLKLRLSTLQPPGNHHSFSFYDSNYTWYFTEMESHAIRPSVSGSLCIPLTALFLLLFYQESPLFSFSFYTKPHRLCSLHCLGKLFEVLFMLSLRDVTPWFGEYIICFYF